MSDASSHPALVSIPEIADIAGVGRSAVGNWRKRHPDFPGAAVTTPSGAMFDLREVEAWLVEKGKITGRISPSRRFWALADAARGQWRPDQTFSFLISALVYLEACDRPGTRPLLAPGTTWVDLRDSSEKDFLSALENAWATTERAVPELEGILTPGLERLATADDADLARRLLEAMAAWDPQDGGRSELYEEAVTRLVSADRFSAKRTTPDDVSLLIAQMADVRHGTVVDPAVGEAGLLLMTALVCDLDGPLTLLGLDRNPEASRLARARVFLYDLSGVAAEIRTENALSSLPGELPTADVVVLDPPYGARDWATADVYLDDRWRFGSPSPRSADLAWIQLATLTLKPTGHAFVLSPATAISRSGTDARVRQALIDAGAVEAVFLLPPRLRTDTSIQLALWVLRSPDAVDAPDEVLLVDASHLGVPGRERYSLDEKAVDELSALLRAWRADRSVPRSSSDFAVGVPTEELLDGGLDPRPHRPRQPIDIEELLGEMARLRATLGRPKPTIGPVLGRDSDPASVPLVPLGELVNIRRGALPGKPSADTTGSPVIGATEISRRAQRFVDVDPDDRKASSRVVQVEVDDLVLVMDSRTGSRLITDAERGWLVAPECAALRVTATERLDPRWLHLWTTSTDFRNQLERHLTGGAMPRLHAGALRGFLVPLPPLDTQVAAVRQLVELEDEIMTTAERLQLLEELRRVETDLLIATAEND